MQCDHIETKKHLSWWKHDKVEQKSRDFPQLYHAYENNKITSK
jgi:hypothetical protein